MKKFFYTSIFLISTFFIAANLTNAASIGSILSKSFGGRVIATTIPGVTCYSGVGPITIKPATGGGPTGSYLAPFGKSTPSVGGQILGLYSKIPDLSSCYTGEPPYEIPYKVYRITLLGVSRY